MTPSKVKQKTKVASEYAGPRFFVDEDCIACDTCTTLAPETFEVDETAAIKQQPLTDDDAEAAEEAREACPVGAIHTEDDV